MNKTMLLIVVSLFFKLHNLSAQYKYACFENKGIKKLQLTVYFKKDKAVLIKYKGQKKAVPLIYSTTEQTPNNSGVPPFFWKETYFVKTGKRITGSYVLTNGGAYELQLSYLDKKSNRKVSFVLIPSLIIEGFSAYRDAPCF